MFNFDYEIFSGALILFSAAFLFIRRLRTELKERQHCEGCSACRIEFDK